MITRVYLIRHGATASNRQRRYMGRSEEGLSSEGRWQARQLALRMASTDLAALYCSPLRRTQETAAIIGQPHALTPEVAADFNELDLSRWQGLTAAEIDAREPEAWHTWCDAPARLRLPGIESFETLQQRVRRGLQALVKRHEGTALEGEASAQSTAASARCVTSACSAAKRPCRIAARARCISAR